jgi:exodeoxyribonuclease-3
VARIGRLTVANVYFPNGSGKERDNSRIPFKLKFYKSLFKLLEPAATAGEPVLVMGDFNTAHREIDLARPKTNQTTSGFCPEERREIDRWLKAGWVDTFRQFHPDAVKYSWWSGRFGVRERNVGWRIDAVFASPGAMPFLRGAFIDDHVQGSDHCPVGVVLDRAAVG